MNVLEAMEPLSIMYCINGSLMFALPHEKPNKSNHWIDQKYKERVQLSKGTKTLININWLITPKCNCDCIYCYAKDIMQCTQEPKLDKLLTTARSILQYDPVVVTLSGGEPFLSPYLEDIILFLDGKTRIIIDTNGSIFHYSLLQRIKEKNVVLRVSLDDFTPQRNSITRGPLSGGPNQTINFILKCIHIGIDVVVQTVVTKINYAHMQETKEYLQALGVKYWRLLPVSNFNHGNELLSCSPQEIQSLRDELCQCSNMDIMAHKEYEKERAGIVLVSPDGSFLTVAKDGKKVYIDPDNPLNPSFEAFNKAIDWDAHFLRYVET